MVVYLSMAFGNPYGERWEEQEVIAACDLLADMGVKQISLADTVGVATAEQISSLVGGVSRRSMGRDRGALACLPEKAREHVTAAYLAGCRRFDTSLGGLGGCPFAQDALMGNVATEAALAELERLGALLPSLRPLDGLLTISAGIASKFGPSVRQQASSPSKDKIMAKSYSTVNVEESDDIHLITMNRPERRNALNPQMIYDLSQALDASAHCSCGVVVLTGAGTAFCAGMDLEHLRSLHDQRPEEQLADAESITRSMRHLHEMTKPTIAAVNGPAIAGGAGLAALCDFTLSVPEAKFGFTEVKVGFIPAVVAVFLLPMIGEKRTRDLLLSGRILDADEALTFGLVTAIAPAQELMAHVRSLGRIAFEKQPRLDEGGQRAAEWLRQGKARPRLGAGHSME